MIRRLYLCALLLMGTIVAYGQSNAQHVSMTLNDVTFSDALLKLQESQSCYNINFLYDELEDFHVTTTVNRKTVPDAIQQMIGFYPIRMTIKPEDKEIYVECVRKTSRCLTGKIIDEHHMPLAYANVAVINPADTTVITGGVSNESGYFAIPVDQDEAVLRVSFVGYKTVWKQCHIADIGTIILQPENYLIDRVTVKADRKIVKAENGRLTYDMTQLLEIIPADNAYEALTRIPGVTTDSDDRLSFAGQQVSLVINGKPTSLSEEQIVERLKQMPAEMLSKAEVMASAPAKYHVRGMTINVVTKDFVGTHQVSGQVAAVYKQDKYAYGQAAGAIIIQQGKLGIDASYSLGYGDAYGKVQHIAHHPLGDKRIDYSDKTDRQAHHLSHNYRLGIDYAFSKDNRLNLAYTGKWAKADATNTSTGLESSVQKSKLHTYLHNVDLNFSSSCGLQLNASYTNYQNPRTQHLDGHLYDHDRNLNANSKQRISKWLFTADQTHELNNGWALNYGSELQLASNKSYQTTVDQNGHILPDATSSVDYDERIFDIYAGFSKQFTPSFSLDASIGTEHYHAPKWNDWRLYPTLNALWNVDENNILNIAFSSQTEYPTYWSTMSSIFYTSAYSEIWGNPDLKPQPSYTSSITWQHGQRYTFTIMDNYMPDYFVQLAYQPSDRMAVIMKETNFNFSNFLIAQASARINWGEWLNATVNLTGTLHHDKSDRFFDIPFDRTKFTAILGGTISAKLFPHHNLILILSPHYQTKAIQGIYDINPYFRLNASVRWTAQNGKWSITLAGNNITNSHVKTYSRLANQDYAMHVWPQYPNVSLTARYRIGGFKEKKTKAVDTSRMGY